MPPGQSSPNNLINYPSPKSGQVETGGEPLDDGAMNARIDRLDHVVERIDGDLTAIRVDVGTIKERLTHLPTTASLWHAVAVSAGFVILAMWAIIQFIAKPWLQQLLQQLTHK